MVKAFDRPLGFPKYETNLFISQVLHELEQNQFLFLRAKLVDDAQKEVVLLVLLHSLFKGRMLTRIR